MSPHKQQHTNLLYLDGIRGVCAIYVMMHHAVLQYYDSPPYYLTGIKQKLISAFSYGHYSVNCFIVLSGFCLMLPVLRNQQYKLKGGSWSFFKRRAIRILPPYYLAMLFTLLLIGLCIGNKTHTHWDKSIPVTKQDVLTHTFLIHDFFMSNEYKINHAFWSISVECRIYLLFPLLLWLWRKTGPWITLAGSVLITILIYALLVYAKTFYPDLNAEGTGVSPYLILFVMGVVGAAICFSPKPIQGLNRKLPVLTMLLISLGIFLFTYKVTPHLAQVSLFLFGGTFPVSIDVTFGLFCTCLLIACAWPFTSGSKVFWLQRSFSWAPLAFTGTFAYSIYLTHPPLLAVLSQYVVTPLHFSRFASAWILVALSIAVIIPLSYIFFLCCEKPFMRLNKKVTLKQTELVAVVNPAP